MRVSGGSECQASITWARSGSSGAYSSPTAALFAAPVSETRTRLGESSDCSSPTRGACRSGTFSQSAASPCKTGVCVLSANSLCDLVRGKTAGCCTGFRTAFEMSSSAMSQGRAWRVARRGWGDWKRYARRRRRNRSIVRTGRCRHDAHRCPLHRRPGQR